MKIACGNKIKNKTQRFDKRSQLNIRIALGLWLLQFIRIDHWSLQIFILNANMVNNQRWHSWTFLGPVHMNVLLLFFRLSGKIDIISRLHMKYFSDWANIYIYIYIFFDGRSTQTSRNIYQLCYIGTYQDTYVGKKC